MKKFLLATLTLLISQSFAQDCKQFFCYSGSAPRCGFYGGATFWYANLDIPQSGLYDVKDVYPRAANIFSVNSKNSNDFNHFCWNLYGGYECVPCGNFLIGVEVGYKKLGKYKLTLRNAQENDSMFQKELASLNDEESLPEELSCLRSFSFCDDEEKLTPFRHFDTHAVSFLFTCRYLWCSGLNVFGKVGAAYVNMSMKEGEFITAQNPGLNNTGPLKKGSLCYHNVYPEIQLGLGWYLNDCINVFVSHGFILGPRDKNFINYSDVEIATLPANIPYIGFIGGGIEFKI